jgi:FtsH-binding integral membrane protein
MFSFSDLFQWERFVTPSIIKPFYWLTVGMVVLFGLSGVASALSTMASSPPLAIVIVFASVVGMLIGIIFARIATEFVLIVFRINEHLGAIRQRAEM